MMREFILGLLKVIAYAVIITPFVVGGVCKIVEKWWSCGLATEAKMAEAKAKALQFLQRNSTENSDKNS